MKTRSALLLGVGLLTLALSAPSRPRAEGPALPSSGDPTPEEYVAKVGDGARIIPAGQLKIDKWSMFCGTRPTVLYDKLDDYAAAFQGYLILNMHLLGTVTTPVKLWVYSHECGHQFRGPDEETADCFAVQRGRRQGWLTPAGLEEVCAFISRSKGDEAHPAGTHRCETMRACYATKDMR